MSEIAAELLRNGVLGLVVLVQGFVIARLWSDYRGEHSARIAEAKETTKQLLEVTEKVNQTVTQLHELGEWIQELRPKQMTGGMKRPV